MGAARGVIIKSSQGTLAAAASACPIVPMDDGPPPFTPLAPLVWFGDDCFWEAGGEPDPLWEVPKIPPGTTDPPGPCKAGCLCHMVASKPSDLEKQWLADADR